LDKVAIILDSLWVGGTERSIAELLPYIVEAKIHPIVICLRHRLEEGIENEVIRQNFDVRILQKGNFLSQCTQLRQLINSERPDLLHSSLFHANLVARFARMRLGTPLLTSLVNSPYEAVRFRDPKISRWRLKIVQMVDGLTSRHLTTHFHAVSHFTKTTAIQSLKISDNDITVVERGRNPVRLGFASESRRNEARKELGLSPEQLVLVNVGRHEYQKGQKYLIEAVSELRSTYPQLVLLIAGRKGASTEKLTRLTDELGLGTTVKFLGHTEEIPKILSAADLFVLPSLFEGLPGAMIEALALSLPIIASDIPSNREVVDANKNAVLVQPESSKALATAIHFVLEDEQRRKTFSLASKKIFDERFNLDRVAPRMIQLYQDVANMKQHR